jgi:hypothetical protein
MVGMFRPPRSAARQDPGRHVVVTTLTQRLPTLAIGSFAKGSAMAHYRVSQARSGSITLEDAIGRRHRARALHDMPAEGTVFHGPRPVCGFAILSDAASRRLCRVIFEQIDCGRDDATDARRAQ